MMQHVVSPLSAWESFYVIVGSSAAALTGLQFVVIALVADARTRSSTSEIDAFGTPTITHFCAVLLVSAVLSAPWHTLFGATFILSACGGAGVGYSALVAKRARRQSGYRMVLEDWIWHIALPCVAYTILLAAAISLARHATVPPFMIGGAALFLLFIGIHNAWDVVTFLAVARVRTVDQPEDRG